MSDEAKSNVALMVRPESAVAAPAQWRQTTDIAGAVRDFVLASIVLIQGKRYPPVVAWQAIANGAGCVGSCSKVERVEGGWLAHGEVRRMSDGVVIATGFGFAGEDEKASWARAQFSIISMAQTRSIGRACRSAFAAVIPIIDKGLETCSAEEMPSVEGEVVAKPSNGKSRTESLRDKVIAKVGTNVKRPTPPEPEVQMSDFSDEEPEPGADEGDVDDSGFQWKWGEKKGSPLSAMSVRDLQWGVKAVTEGLQNPAKAKFHEQDRLYLDALKRELARKGAK